MTSLITALPEIIVALRMESVDRNALRFLARLEAHSSLSVWRAWIEIPSMVVIYNGERVSLSVWRAWIEISYQLQTKKYTLSLSVWRAWIEIRVIYQRAVTHLVALRMESVDRNADRKLDGSRERNVALRMESVDRNTTSLSGSVTLYCRSPYGERG